MIQAKINGKSIQLLLDTGSAVTLLRFDAWTQCKSHTDKLEQWTGSKLVGVNGTPLQVAGYGKVTVSLTYITLTHPVLVVDSLLSEGILGLDFLQHHNCSVDLAKGKSILYVGPHRVAVPLSPVTRVGHNNCISVIIAHTICIPESGDCSNEWFRIVLVMEGHTC